MTLTAARNLAASGPQMCAENIKTGVIMMISPNNGLANKPGWIVMTRKEGMAKEAARRKNPPPSQPNRVIEPKEQAEAIMGAPVSTPEPQTAPAADEFTEAELLAKGKDNGKRDLFVIATEKFGIPVPQTSSIAAITALIMWAQSKAAQAAEDAEAAAFKAAHDEMVVLPDEETSEGFGDPAIEDAPVVHATASVTTGPPTMLDGDGSGDPVAPETPGE